MAGINLQIRIPNELGLKLSKAAPRSKSEFVREAIEEKLTRDAERAMEERWIEALAKKSDKTDADADWVKAQSWSIK